MCRVSVIIPAYNSENYIAEAIQSVFAQTYRDYEIIIINDGSTDRTMERVKPFAGIENIRIITQGNAGPSRARNLGIKAARGTYCAFLDSDDIMMPGRLELQVATMEKRRDIGMVYSDLMTFNEGGIVHRSKKVFTRPYSGEVLDKLVLGNFITTSTVMTKRECFENVGLFDEKMKHSEDYKMWLNIAKTHKIEYLDVPLIKYRYQPYSLSSDRVTITASSYGVIKEFWEENKDYRATHKLLYRRSLAHHLMSIGEACRYYGKTAEAASVLMKSAVTYPLDKETYKVLIKILLNVFRRRCSWVDRSKQLYT